MPVASIKKTPASDIRGFLPIGLDTLCPTPVLEFDLFLRGDDSGSAVLYREQSYPLKREDLSRLAEQEIRTLYIRSSAHADYRRYLFEDVLPNEDVASIQRYQILRTATESAFDSAFRSVNLDNMVQFAGQFAKRMTDILCGRDLVLGDLFSLMEHDYYTYTHVTNVATCCIVLAQKLGIESRADLLGIATGALLHDTGKRRIPPAVLNKPGKLTPAQRRIVQEHSQAGFAELCLREDLSWGQLMMVYQHHERMDGQGYPVGLLGEEIHPWARICAIADVYDALSTARPYRQADSVREVLDFLEQRARREFDQEMVKCWIATIRGKS